MSIGAESAPPPLTRLGYSRREPSPRTVKSLSLRRRPVAHGTRIYRAETIRVTLRVVDSQTGMPRNKRRLVVGTIVVALVIGFAAFELESASRSSPGVRSTKTQTFSQSSRASETFQISTEGGLPKSFSLDGYAFSVSDTGPPPLPNSTETATEITVHVYNGPIAQETSFLWVGTWSTYELPTPVDAEALGGAVSYQWAKLHIPRAIAL